MRESSPALTIHVYTEHFISSKKKKELLGMEGEYITAGVSAVHRSLHLHNSELMNKCENEEIYIFVLLLFPHFRIFLLIGTLCCATNDSSTVAAASTNCLL